LAPKTNDAAIDSLGHFQRISKPGKVQSIKTAMIDEFISKRRLEAGLKPGSVVSPATINKDLRHIKAALRIAKEWGYLPEVPKIRMVKEPQKLPTFVTPEHFDLIYNKACDLARFPNEEVIPLNTVVIEHLQKIVGTHPLVFPWNHDPRTLWTEFTRMQAEAGIHLVCREKHDHTASCHVYGFHDFRRAFATVNAPRLKPEVLQRLMRHKSYQTTQKFYINPTNQMQDAVSQMPIPAALKNEQSKESQTEPTSEKSD
jgi:integrase